jgi:hypothetical protein
LFGEKEKWAFVSGKEDAPSGGCQRDEPGNRTDFETALLAATMGMQLAPALRANRFSTPA